MAKLKAPVGGTGLQIEIMAPVGQHVALCLRVNDQFGVERVKWRSATGEKEMKDVTRFIFGLFGTDRKPYLIQTYEFTISGAPGSNLMDFLKNWLGTAPMMGWDYAEQLHKAALITVAHTASKTNPGKLYADITNIAAVPTQMSAYVPTPAHFEAMLVELEKAAAAKNPAPAGAPPPLPGGTPGGALPPPPPAGAPAGAPPPPPAAAPDTRQFWVNHAGTTLPAPVGFAQLAQYPGAHVMLVGETTWKTAAAYATGAVAPAGAPAGVDEDVPF